METITEDKIKEQEKENTAIITNIANSLNRIGYNVEEIKCQTPISLNPYSRWAFEIVISKS
jgi:hypothetical protein